MSRTRCRDCGMLLHSLQFHDERCESCMARRSIVPSWPVAKGHQSVPGRVSLRIRGQA